MTVKQSRGASRWRTADIPAPVLAVLILAWAAADLLCAGYGGPAGIVVTAGLLAAAIVVVIVWSGAPPAPNPPNRRHDDSP